MRRPVFFMLFVAAVFPVAASAQITVDRERMSVRDGQLLQGKNPFPMRAIEVPDFLQRSKLHHDMATTLARIAEVGGNTICFTLNTYDENGNLAATTRADLREAMEQVTWRRMTAICRVFPQDAPPDPDKRQAMAHSAAEELKGENRVVYWIDGTDASAIAQAFKDTAPSLTVAAEAGGDLNTITALPVKDIKKPALLLNAIVPLEQRETVHFVLPPDDASYAALEEAMKNPAESKPWTPDNALLSEQERAEGFVSLFDGKSLDGWWIIGPNKAGFAASDGRIEWKQQGGGGLYTRDRYGDFTLRLEWKINSGGNSGLYLRAPRAGRQSKIGMEFQLQGDAGTPITNQTTGAIYDVVPPQVNATKPAGEWNQVEITLYGAHMKAILNGQVVQDTDLEQSDELHARLTKGFIGLQDHASFVAFRNIRIKRL